ncbi:hypothetical protein [Microbacterium sp. LWO12-1.2]|uniref:hypothetical protein n=1 Tax=Microbacterium sp. LWO12-1.2 TaxID=3135261 RepID=UPI00341E7B0B
MVAPERAAVFLAAAVRAVAAVFFTGAVVVSDRPASACVDVTGSITTSALAAAFSAADFAFVRAVGAVDGFFAAAGFFVAVVRAADFPAAGARFTGGFFAAAAPVRAVVRFAVAFAGGVSGSSTWSVRSSGEEVTVLRYQ